MLFEGNAGKPRAAGTLSTLGDGRIMAPFCELNDRRLAKSSGMASSFEVRLQEARANRLDHSEFLELVLQDELLIWQGERIQCELNEAPRKRSFYEAILFTPIAVNAH